jgi:hypothetical protein
VRQVLFSIGIVAFWALLIVPLVVISDPHP